MIGGIPIIIINIRVNFVIKYANQRTYKNVIDSITGNSLEYSSGESCTFHPFTAIF